MRTVSVGVLVLAAAFGLAACSEAATKNSAAIGESGGASSSVAPGLVVGMGDSYMSGEGGRWVTNGIGNGTEFVGYPGGTGTQVGATPQDVYSGGTDSKASGPLRGCHRSPSAPMNVGNGWESINLACSGAKTASFTEGGLWKPGIDSVAGNAVGKQGQTAALEELAQSTPNIRAIVLSIGGNDMGFAPLIKSCVTAYAKPTLISTPCMKMKANQELVSPAAKVRLEQGVDRALTNVDLAMTGAGYKRNDYRIIYQLVPGILPTSATVREADTGYNRLNKCGLPMTNSDLDWAEEQVRPFLLGAVNAGVEQFRRARPGGPVVTTVDVSDLFVGHRLCEKGATQLGDSKPTKGYEDPNWSTTGETTEWVRRINLKEQGSPFKVPLDALSEPMHPMYWGQRALAACNLKALESATNVTSVTCDLAGGLDPADARYPAVKLAG